MNLTQLQEELRSIEEQISSLHNEIENMKPKTEEQKKKDFEKITVLAAKHPIVNAEIASAEEKKNLFSSLSYILSLEQNSVDAGLLYLTRLAIGCNLKLSAEELYKAGLEFKKEDLNGLTETIQKHKYTYLTEAMILVNLTANTSSSVLALISELATIMDCDKEEIRVIAQVAKSRLIDNINLILDIPLPSKNRWSGKFLDYIPHEWIVSQRKKCAEICLEESITHIGMLGFATIVRNRNTAVRHSCVVKNRTTAGRVVEKGEFLLSYEQKEYDDKNENQNTKDEYERYLTLEYHNECIGKQEITVKAPCNGIVYFVEDEKYLSENWTKKYLAVYVVSYFDDYHDFVSWYKGNQ